MYTKSAVSREAQAEMLISQGLTADKDELIMRIETVGFYRLNGYAHPFRQIDSDGNILPVFVQCTSLEKLWGLYRFDRKLRFLFLDAIERIEVALRSQLAYLHTQANGPFIYASEHYFPAWKDYMRCWKRVEKGSKEAAKNEALKNFFARDTENHTYPPLEIAISFLELGPLVYFFDYSDKETVRKPIVKTWGVDSKFISSWMHALNHLRNDCAHHARIWNKRFFQLPQIPKCTKDARWYCVYDVTLGEWIQPQNKLTAEAVITSDSMACFLFICRTLLRALAPTSAWHQRITSILQQAEQDGIDLTQMGLPKHWESHPLWK